jgi:YVTN family beta-propeller protein
VNDQVRPPCTRLVHVGAFCLSALACAGRAHAAFVPSGFQPINLGAFGADADYDPRRGVIYVSNPDRDEVAVVSVATRQVVDRIPVGDGPQGLDVSDDGRFLYVALDPGAAVSRVDLNTRQHDLIDVELPLGTTHAFDVVEGRPGRVYVTGAASSSGYSYVLMINTTAGDQITRVASDRVIRGAPFAFASPGRDALYVREDFSPNSLYKLDIRDERAPIVAENPFSSLNSTRMLDISPDGSLIYLLGGQVLSSDTLSEIGRLGPGVPTVSEDGSLVYMVVGDHVDVYDATTRLKEGEFPLGPIVGLIRKVDLLPGDAGMYVLEANTLYLSGVPEPTAALVLAIGLPAMLLRPRRANGRSRAVPYAAR